MREEPGGTQIQLRTRTEFEVPPEEVFGQVQCLSPVERNADLSKVYQVPSDPSEFFKRGKVCCLVLAGSQGEHVALT